MFGLFRVLTFEMLGTGLLVSMYTTETPIGKWRFNVTQLKDILFFYIFCKRQMSIFFFICIKDVNAQTITSLKLNLFMSLFTAVGIMKGKRPVLIYFIVKQTMRYRIPVFIPPFSWHLHITITYNLPHLRL